MAKTTKGLVIFDADGVVIDSIGIHDEIGKICAKEFDLPDFDIHSQDIRTVFKRAGLPAVAYDKYLKIFAEHEKVRGVRAFPFANDVISELRERGYMTGIFSNRKLRSHNHEIFFNSGLDYKLLDFFMMPLPSGPEPEISSKPLHPIYLPTNFSKPYGFAAFPLYELIQEIKGAPHSTYHVDDNEIGHLFAVRNNFSFIGVLSGATKSKNKWLQLGVKAPDIVPDMRNILEVLP